MKSPVFERRFIEEFVDRCSARLAAIRMVLRARGAGEFSCDNAFDVIAHELHGLAGEASLLEFPAIATPAATIAESLRRTPAPERVGWLALELWLTRFLKEIAAAVDGDSSPEKLDLIADGIVALTRAPKLCPKLDQK
jgi:HPt (histidine-containing phosphotransfer) domain-containing protein